MNRFVWNMRYPDAHKIPEDATTERSLSGPKAPPGTYQVQLAVGDQRYSETFEIRKDPRLPATPEDLEAQFALLIRIRDKLSVTHDGILQLRNVRQQVDEWVSRTRAVSTAEGEETPTALRVSEASNTVKDRLTAIEEELIQTRATAALDSVNFPTRLNNKLASAEGEETPTALRVSEASNTQQCGSKRRRCAYATVLPGFRGSLKPH